MWSEESARSGTPVMCHDQVLPMHLRYLNVFNKEGLIGCDLPRGRRSNAGKVYCVTSPWHGRNKHFTQEFEVSGVPPMRAMPLKRGGKILGENAFRVCWVLFAQVMAAYARLSFDNMVWVGADAMNRRQWHN